MISSAQRLALAALALATMLAHTQRARAYCLTTVCDERYTCEEKPDICCVRDAQNCDVNTPVISWPTSCVSYSVHEDGSEMREISSRELAGILDRSYEKWLSAECPGGGSVALAIDYRGKAQCGEPEYNQDSKANNANIWMFRDQGTRTGMSSDNSVLSDAALAVTTVSFNEDTAQIYDVDVELLSSISNFTTGDEFVDIDLESVAIHEAGHFLGLDHSGDPDATMNPGYTRGTITNRTLEPDDQAGICAAYPENRSFPGGRTCEPRGGYSPECYEKGCGCSVAGTDGSRPQYMWLSLAIGLSAWARRRHSRRTRLIV